MVKNIKEKKNTDFCGTYELMCHDKMKKSCNLALNSHKTMLNFKNYQPIRQKLVGNGGAAQNLIPTLGSSFKHHVNP